TVLLIVGNDKGARVGDKLLGQAVNQSQELLLLRHCVEIGRPYKADMLESTWLFLLDRLAELVIGVDGTPVRPLACDRRLDAWLGDVVADTPFFPLGIAGAKTFVP